jgi:hemoglobin
MTSNHAEQVRARKTADALACGIDDAFISQLVESFYDTVRQDDMLGPIFAERIGDWPHHLARMKDFWASIMLEAGRFSGSPMRKHIGIGELDETHFARWRSLWDQTLARIAPNAEAADRFRAAAQRIGESLLTGIQIDRDGLPAISAKAGSRHGRPMPPRLR